MHFQILSSISGLLETKLGSVPGMPLPSVDLPALSSRACSRLNRLTAWRRSAGELTVIPFSERERDVREGRLSAMQLSW